MLFTVSGMESLVESTSDESSTDVEDLAPLTSTIVAQPIHSARSTEITTRSTWLSVRAKENGQTEGLSYQWSVVSAPDGGEVYFRAPNASQTGTIFSKAGSYTLRVTVSNDQGSSVTQDIELNVIPVLTHLQVVTEDGRNVSHTSSTRVAGQWPSLRVVALDQFRNPTTEQPGVTWTIGSSNPGSMDIQQQGDLTTFQFSEAGWYQAEATMGGLAIVTNFDARFMIIAPPVISESDEATIDPVEDREVPLSVDISTSLTQSSADESTADKEDRISINEQEHVTVAGRRIATPEELKLALDEATGGEVLLLEPNVDFGGVRIFNRQIPANNPVVIGSADSSNPALFNWIAFQESSGFIVDGVRVEASERSAAVTIADSSAIAFRNSLITAHLDPFLADQRLVMGVLLRRSSNIEVSGNTITGVGTGMSTAFSQHVLISGNVFKENLKDSLLIGSNSSDLKVDNNSFYAQLNKLFAEHHFDTIQLWVRPDATENSRNISITDNFIMDATGNVRPQAIFGRSDLQDNYIFENIEIRGNVIVTQQANAISFAGVRGLEIHNNTLVYAGNGFSNPEAVDIPGVNYRLSSNVRITGNVLPDKFGYSTMPESEFFDNTVYDVAAAEHVRLLLNPLAIDPQRSDFASLPVAALRNSDGSYRGAFLSQGAADVHTPVMVFSHQFRESQFHYTFDASHSLPATDGSLANAHFEWVFADGTRATGAVIDKVFEAGGAQAVTLIVTDNSGRQAVLKKQGIVIKESAVLRMDFEQGLYDATSTASRVITTGDALYGHREDNSIALKVGGADGHLYLDASDSDLREMSATRELSVAFKIQVGAFESQKSLTLAARHGVWNVSLAPSGQLQVMIAGERYQVTPPTSLLGGAWHEFGVVITDAGLTVFVDGKASQTVAMSLGQADAVFAANGYGIGIGGSGPWAPTANRTQGASALIDDLLLTTSALDLEQSWV